MGGDVLTEGLPTGGGGGPVTAAGINLPAGRGTLCLSLGGEAAFFVVTAVGTEVTGVETDGAVLLASLPDVGHEIPPQPL
jgi:hypothetical protein